MTPALLLLLAAEPLVSEVQLDVPPLERARLARYLAIRPGETLRPDQVRDAVRRLYATGEFEDVVVEQRPGSTGVELLFRPIPAPHLERVRIEGDAVISAREARRVTRLRYRETLWPGRLDRAAQDLALALVARGYLEARVSASRRVSETRPGWEAIFTVASGPLVRVSSVAIAGTNLGLRMLLAPMVRPTAGAVFQRAKAVAAAERMRQQLVAGGRWRARVFAHESYDPGSGRVALSFDVELGPFIRVEFQGDPASASVRHGVLQLLREGGASVDARDAAAERLEADLRRRGHRNASAAHSVESLPGAERLVYDVHAGPAWTASAVRILGFEATPTLLSTREGEPIREDDLDEDVRSLTRALQEAGYFEARVESEVPESGGAVPVVFRAQPGPRCLVESVSVVAPEGTGPAQGTAAPELRTRASLPYRARDVALDRRTLLSAWRNAGYTKVEVTPEVVLSEDRGTAVVTLRVTPGERITIDQIIVRGLHRTREDVVRRELLVKEGGPLGLADLLESQRRLGSLAILERASLAELEADAPGRRSLLLDASEAPATTFAYGVGYGERDLLRGSLEVTRRNLLGLDRTLTAFGRGSFRSSRLLLGFREPYLFGRRLDLFVTGFREEEDRQAFDFVRGGGFLQTAIHLKARRTLIARYGYQRTNTFNVNVPEDEVDRQFRDGTVSGPSFSVVEDSRDDPLDPRRGHFVGADIQLSMRALGGDPFLKGYLQASSYRRVLPRALLAVGARLGLARTIGVAARTRLPLPERFFAGGDFSFRGFETDGVLKEGGNSLLLGSLELRVETSERFSLALFSDLGNVFPFASDIDLGALRKSAGTGLRYRSAFGPLRLDLAFKLDRRPGEKLTRLHFTVGHAF